MHIPYFHTHNETKSSAFKHSEVNSEERPCVSLWSRSPKALKLSSSLRSSTPCSSLRRSLILTGCRSPSITMDPPGTSTFTTRALRWGCGGKKNISPSLSFWLQSTCCYTLQGTEASVLLIAGNCYMVQRHPCCSLCVPEDCVSYRERWGSRCLCVYVCSWLMWSVLR